MLSFIPAGLLDECYGDANTLPQEHNDQEQDGEQNATGDGCNKKTFNEACNNSRFIR